MHKYKDTLLCCIPYIPTFTSTAYCFRSSVGFLRRQKIRWGYNYKCKILAVAKLHFSFQNGSKNLSKNTFSRFFVFWYILSLVVSVMQHWISLGCHTCVTTQKLSHKMPKSTNVCPSKKHNKKQNASVHKWSQSILPLWLKSMVDKIHQF